VVADWKFSVDGESDWLATRGVVPWRSYGRPDSGPQPRLLSSERECAAATDPAVLFHAAVPDR
jgi:hypothetical protein